MQELFSVNNIIQNRIIEYISWNFLIFMSQVDSLVDIFHQIPTSFRRKTNKADIIEAWEVRNIAQFLRIEIYFLLEQFLQFKSLNVSVIFVYHFDFSMD